MLGREIGRWWGRAFAFGVATFVYGVAAGAAPGTGTGAGGERGGFDVAPGFRIEPVAHDTLKPAAMAWDDSGALWMLELRQGTRGRPALRRVGSFGADGTANDVRVIAGDLAESDSFVVSRDDAYLGIPGAVLHVGADGRRTPHRLPPKEFPAGAAVSGLRWGPDLRIYFCFSGADASGSGIGRFDPRSGKVELYSEGLDPRSITFDPDGFPLARHVPSGDIFQVAPGGRYLTGPQIDEGVPTQSPPLLRALPREVTAGGFAVYDGGHFPEENHGTLLVARAGSGAIRQLRLARRGGTLLAESWRDLVTPVDGTAFDPVAIDVGPDGAVWILDRAGACPGAGGRLWRLVHGAGGVAAPWPSPRDLTEVGTSELVEMLKRPDAWGRRAATAALGARKLEGADRYHHDTPIHPVLEKGTTGRERLAALHALHALDLLDEDKFENAADDEDEAVRAWVAIITGERGMPVALAMKRLHTLSRDKSVRVRLAAAWAARWFVSGSLVRDTPPAIHPREVVTGPVLSGLWFGLTGANDPALYTAYWNALRPVTAFDPVHAIGFYEQDGAAGEMPMSGWVLRKIMAQACSLDPRKLEDAVVQMGKIPMPAAAPVVAAGLDGLIEGSRAMKAPPGQAALDVVSRWAASDDPRVAEKAKRLLATWQSGPADPF